MARISVASEGEKPHPIVPQAHLKCYQKVNQSKDRDKKQSPKKLDMPFIIHGTIQDETTADDRRCTIKWHISVIENRMNNTKSSQLAKF